MAKAFDEMGEIGKKPIIAQIGGFRPEDNIKSWFGGNFLLNNINDWPKNENGLMIPVLQIAIDELLQKIKYFNDIKLIQIFLDSVELPLNGPVKNGNKWLIKFYDSIENLTKVSSPAPVKIYKEFQIKWIIGDTNYSCREESWNFVDLNEVNDDQELTEQFFDKFIRYYQTKIHGYASYIQSPCLDNLNFVLQISSEEKPNFMIANNGKLYIGYNYKENEWFLNCDCY